MYKLSQILRLHEDSEDDVICNEAIERIAALEADLKQAQEEIVAWRDWTLYLIDYCEIKDASIVIDAHTRADITEYVLGLKDSLARVTKERDELKGFINVVSNQKTVKEFESDALELGYDPDDTGYEFAYDELVRMARAAKSKIAPEKKGGE